MGTLRLELDDATLREWDAQVLRADAEGIVLDRSAFYPGGGGQPPDAGVLLWGGVQTRIAGARKTADDIYLRFHGTKRWYRHDYSKEDLVVWAERIRQSGARRVWAYFNNDWEGYAIRNARAMLRLLRGDPAA